MAYDDAEKQDERENEDDTRAMAAALRSGPQLAAGKKSGGMPSLPIGQILNMVGGAGAGAGALDMGTAGAADAVGTDIGGGLLASLPEDAMVLAAGDGYNGVVSQPTHMVVGEKGPEAVNVQPLSDDMADMGDLLNTMSPEARQTLLGASTVPEEQKLLQEQMARALSLRQPRAGQHTTGAGAALGGLGDVINAARSGYMEAKTAKEQRANVERERSSQNAYAMALRQVAEERNRRRAAKMPDSQPTADRGDEATIYPGSYGTPGALAGR